MSSTLQSIASAIPSIGKAKLLINSNDDVVICSTVRTALTKVSSRSSFFSSILALETDDLSFWINVLRLQAKKGGFKDTCPEELLAAVLREAYTRAKLDPSKIE